MILFCQRPGVLESEISNFKSEISDLLALAESCSRQIRAWAEQLQNTDIQGQRRLNDKTRQAFAAQRSTEAFMQKLQDIRNTAGKRNTIHQPA